MVLEKERFYCQDKLKLVIKLIVWVETFSMGNIHILTLGAVWINMEGTLHKLRRGSEIYYTERLDMYITRIKSQYVLFLGCINESIQNFD